MFLVETLDSTLEDISTIEAWVETTNSYILLEKISFSFGGDLVVEGGNMFDHFQPHSFLLKSSRKSPSSGD